MLVVMWNCNSRNMTDMNLFINALFLAIAIIFSAIPQCSSVLSDKRLCYDPNCSEPISLARTTIKYSGNEPGLLPFDVNVQAKVYSKEAGKRKDLWGVEINGKRGYVPKSFLREYKVLQKNLSYVVSIDPSSNNVLLSEKPKPKKDKDKPILDTKDTKALDEHINNLNIKSTEELPHNVTTVIPPYEVIDGTTVHLDQKEVAIEPAFVKESIQATVLPNTLQDAVDDSGLSLPNGKTESDVFTETDKVSQEVLNDELKPEELTGSVKVDIKDFVTSSEEILSSSEISSEQVLPLNLSTGEAESTIKNVENKLFTEVQDKKSMKEVIDPNASQTPISDDAKEILNIKSEVVVELDKKENIISNDTVANNDTKPDIGKTGTIGQIQTQDSVQLLKNVTVVANNDIKSEVQTVEIIDTIKTQDTQPSEVVDTIKTQDTQPLEVVDTTKTQDIQPLEVVDTIKTQDTQLLEVVDTIKTQDTQPSEVIDTIKTQDTQPLESVTTVATGDMKLVDEQNLEISDNIETKDSESLENVTVGVSNNTESEIQHAGSSDKVEIADTQSLESVTIVPTNDTGPDIQNVESTEKLETEDIPLLDSVTTNAKDTPQFESITEGTQQNELKKEGEESKSIEDLSKHGNNEYMSPLFLQLSMKNEIPITLSSNNIEAPPQMIENTNEFETQNVPSNSNIMDTFIKEGTPDADDTILAEEATSDVQYDSNIKSTLSIKEAVSENNFYDTSDLIPQESSPVCMADNVECFPKDTTQNDFPHHEQFSEDNETAIISEIQMDSNYWLTLIYLSVTATAMLIFSLGFYCIENMRRDRQLIARINKLEKDLLISEAECAMVNDNLKSTKEKLSRMEDESFGSDEMVLSLRVDLEASQSAKTELEDQVAMLEKDLESATEAGLELEKMLREFLSTNNEVNPLAQSVEDLQTRLNAQQTANESLTNALNLKTQENEALSAELISVKKKYEELDMEFTRVTENLKLALSSKNSLEQMLTDKVQQLEMQIKEISTEKATLQKELKGKEAEAKDLVDVISRLNSNNLDLDKLYDVSHIKTEAAELLEERNELKVRLAEVEGAHNLLEEHVKVVKEEMVTLSEQCKAAEKEKKDAETRLEVLTNFFEEKEAQRQKEEAIWLQQQGEVVSTVERIQTMQSEIQNYKQQIEMLKREILDQEREYKNQISVLQTKAHEQWVIARQVERRLEESKVEAGQLRNRLTLIEKNINEVDSEAKLHRLEANGETTTSPPLFLGAESSSSPIMFSGSSSVPPPPPPSYLHSLFPPYLPPPLPNTSGVPPYEVSQRPPPLGGRLSSPPPMPLHPAASSRYDNASSPPPMSPHLLPPFNHRSPPPPFVSDMHPPPPPPPGSILPPPLGTPHSWGEESLPHPRNSGFHPAQRERVRNHKGSLHSSGDSLDKLHHNSKV